MREVGINASARRHGIEDGDIRLAIHAMRMTKQYRRLLEGHGNG